MRTSGVWSAREAELMTTNRSRHAVHYCVKLFNQGNLEWVDRCYRDDAEWIQLPNSLAPEGMRGNREFLRENARLVLRMFPDRTMRILSTVVEDDRVVLELDWFGTAAATAGGFTAGTVLHTRVASFFVVTDSLIVKHTDYPVPIANESDATRRP
jgi:ketosteroid isomerase-like protein